MLWHPRRQPEAVASLPLHESHLRAGAPAGLAWPRMVTSRRQGCRASTTRLTGSEPGDCCLLKPRATMFPWVGLSRRCVGGDARSLLRTGSDRAICDSDMSPDWGVTKTCWSHLDLLTCWVALDKALLVPLSVCSRRPPDFTTVPTPQNTLHHPA